MLTKEEARARVEKGLTFLLERGHQFDLDISQIRLGVLNISSGQLCILGQAYTGPCARDRTPYSMVRDAGAFPDGFEGVEMLCDYGFSAGWCSEYMETCDLLENAWREALTEHRALVLA